ncbi:MAG: hypothetical protein ABIF17_02480 [Patescibacteria group bacterium]
MQCEKCGYEVPEGSDACNRCGEEIKKEKMGGFTMADDNKIISKDVIDDKYFHVPPAKFIFLSIVTLGFYELYWFYKNWQVVQKHQEKKISPFWRSVFTVLYCYSLFKKIIQSAEAMGYKEKVSAGALTGIYIIILFISEFFGQLGEVVQDANPNLVYFSWLSVFSFIPLLKLQQIIEWNNGHTAGGEVRTGKGEKILIILGVILFIFTIAGIFIGE